MFTGLILRPRIPTPKNKSQTGSLLQAVKHHVLHHLLPDTISHCYTLFDAPSDITLYLKKADERTDIRRAWMTGILLLDNCLETFIDILILFLLHSCCNQSRYARLKLKLLID